MDAARTVKRMGVDEAMIIYRRDRDHMPAHSFEADEAEAEGVNIHWLRTIQDIEGSDFNVEIMEIGDDGRPRPTGRYETLAVDSLILALGQDVERGMLDRVPGLEFDRWGSLTVDENMMTGCEGLFAGGDMVPSDRTATIAVGHGKKAARCMGEWLQGKAVREALRPEKMSNIWWIMTVCTSGIAPRRIVNMRMLSLQNNVMISEKWSTDLPRLRFVLRPVVVSPAVTVLNVMAASGPVLKGL